MVRFIVSRPRYDFASGFAEGAFYSVIQERRLYQTRFPLSVGVRLLAGLNVQQSVFGENFIWGVIVHGCPNSSPDRACAASGQF